MISNKCTTLWYHRTHPLTDSSHLICEAKVNCLQWIWRYHVSQQFIPFGGSSSFSLFLVGISCLPRSCTGICAARGTKSSSGRYALANSPLPCSLAKHQEGALPLPYPAITNYSCFHTKRCILSKWVQQAESLYSSICIPLVTYLRKFVPEFWDIPLQNLDVECFISNSCCKANNYTPIVQLTVVVFIYFNVYLHFPFYYMLTFCSRPQFE